MQKRLNKKAQDLSIGTLILIVLGIIVLVLLILGFSYGWSNLWEKINIFGGKTSISDVVTNCNLAVTSNAVYTYCSEFKKLTIDGKVEYVNCLDNRVQESLESKITTCTEDVTASANKYCAKLNEDKKLTKEVKINNIPCVPTA